MPGPTKLPAWDPTAGKAVEVSPEELTQRFAQGQLHVVGDQPYQLTGDESGAVYEVAGRDAAAAIKAGYRFATREEIATHDANKPGQAWRAAAEGAAEAIPGGTAGLVALGADPVDIKARQEAHPIARTTGMVAGVLGETALLGATGLPTLGATLGGEALAAGTAEALGAARAAALTGRMATAAAGAVPDGVIYGVGNLANEASLGDANFTAESMLAHAGMGAFVGAALGGVGGAVGKALEGRGSRVLPAQATKAEVRELTDRAGVPEVGAPWPTRPRGAHNAETPPSPVGATEANDLLGRLKESAQEFVPGRGWVRRSELPPEEATLPDALAPTVRPPPSGDTTVPSTHPPVHDVFDLLKPAGRDVLTPAADALNVSGAFGALEGGEAGAVGRKVEGLEHDFGLGQQRIKPPNLDELTPEQRDLWQHYQNFERKAPTEPEVGATPPSGAGPAPEPATPAAQERIPAWLKNALLDVAAYHVAGPLGPIGRRAVGAYLKSDGGEVVMARAMAAISRVGDHIDSGVDAFVRGVAPVAAGAQRAVTAATTRMVAATSQSARRDALEARIAELQAPITPDNTGVPTHVAQHLPTASSLLVSRVATIQQQLLAHMPGVPSTRIAGTPNVKLVPDAEVRRFAAVDSALQDPLSVIDILASGKLPHPDVLPAVAQAYPGLYQRMTTAVAQSLASNPNVKYQTAVKLSLAFGLQGHATMAPSAIASQQTAIAAPAQPGKPSGTRNKTPSPRGEPTELDKIMER